MMSALVAAACSGTSGPGPEATTAAAKPGEAAYVASVCSAFEVGSNAASLGDNGIAGAERYIQETIDQPRALLSVPFADSKVRTWRMPIAGEAYTGIWHDRYYVDGSKLAEAAASLRTPNRG